MRSALTDFGADLSTEEELRWLWLAGMTAMRLWDDDDWDLLAARYVELARETGALSELPLALTLRAFTLLFAGDLTAAASLIDELDAVKEATGSGLAPYAALGLAALRGDEAEASALIKATKEDGAGGAREAGSPSPSGRTPCSTTGSAATTKPSSRPGMPRPMTRILRCSVGLWSSWSRPRHAVG